MKRSGFFREGIQTLGCLLLLSYLLPPEKFRKCHPSFTGDNRGMESVKDVGPVLSLCKRCLLTLPGCWCREQRRGGCGAGPTESMPPCQLCVLGHTPSLSRPPCSPCPDLQGPSRPGLRAPPAVTSRDPRDPALHSCSVSVLASLTLNPPSSFLPQGLCP